MAITWIFAREAAHDLELTSGQGKRFHEINHVLNIR
jgi:hypothetical protein